jgi:hypothetical protein
MRAHALFFNNPFLSNAVPTRANLLMILLHATAHYDSSTIITHCCKRNMRRGLSNGAITAGVGWSD